MTSALGLRPARVARRKLPAQTWTDARARAQNSRTTRRNSIELNKSSGWRRVKDFPRSTLSASPSPTAPASAAPIILGCCDAHPMSALGPPGITRIEYMFSEVAPIADIHQAKLLAT